MQAKKITKKVLLWVGAAICCLACNPDCPDKTTTVYVYDTIDNTCLPCIDSAKFEALEEIDDRLQAALQEALIFREMAQYQVDTMRENMFRERDRIIERLDSLKMRLVAKDNMIIQGDSLDGAEVFFDPETGKPTIRFPL